MSQQLSAGLVDRLNKGVNALNKRRELVQTTEDVTVCVGELTPETFSLAIEQVRCKGLRLLPEVTTDESPRYLVHMSVSP